MIRPGIRRILGIPVRGRGSLADHVDEEIRLHLELRRAELIERGWVPDAAEREARRRFGDLEESRRVMRRMANWRTRRMNAREWLATFRQDIRYGARQLRRSPGFAAASVLALALGIGANTAIFSFVDGLLLRPPAHVDEPERLVRVYTSDFSGPLYGASSYPDYVDFSEGLGSAAELAAIASAPPMPLVTGDEAELVAVEYATPNYFSLLGVDPVVGRLFVPGSATEWVAEIVLGYDLWRRSFGGRAGVVGEIVRVNGQSLTVVGVAPRGFGGPGGREPADAYVPIGVLPAIRSGVTGPLQGGASTPAADSFFGRRGSRGLAIVGRLPPGVTADVVSSRLEAIGAALFADDPGAWTDVRDSPRRVTTIGGRQAWLSPSVHRSMIGFAGVLMGLVGLVLLIACANVANLLLARGTTRRREVAVRLAMGAGRGRLVRQFFTESLLLAGAGGTIGMILAVSVTSVLRRVGQALPINAAFDVRLDLRVLLFAVGVSIFAGIVFGLLPAVATARRDAVSTLKGEGLASGRESSTLRAGLVAGQVAICVVLLICASLLVRSLRNAFDTGLGFEAARVLLVPLAVPAPGYTPETGQNFYNTALERIGTLPGVEQVALGQQVPLSGAYSRRPFLPEGYQPGPGEDMELDFSYVSPGYLELMRIPVAGGLAFDESDREGAAPVVIVNQAFVDRFWPGQDVVGRRLGMGPTTMQIIGVAETTKLRALDEEPRPNVYLPLAQRFSDRMTLHVRTVGDPAELLPSVRAELGSIDPDLPIAGERTLESAIAGQVLPLRMAGTLFSGFGLVALTIAMIGLYGVLAYSVGQRTREIGIRIALGATGGRLALSIVLRGMLLVGVGVGLGLLGGLVAARPLAGLLFGVSVTDRNALALLIGLISVISLLASYLPARRATRVDPMVAIRQT
ncbi:MAG: FtsX-like permease family protein [Gemmatimonas sp.]|nr:FtsX-like permease family protein [Gemmatimonas sp.]